MGDPSSHRKVVAHPQAGPVDYDCEVIQPTDADLRIVVFSSPAAPAEESAATDDNHGPALD